MELTKPQQKQVRILLDPGLQRMYERAINDTFTICESFNKNPDNPREANMKMHKTVTEWEKKSETDLITSLDHIISMYYCGF